MYLMVFYDILTELVLQRSLIPLILVASATSVAHILYFVTSMYIERRVSGGLRISRVTKFVLIFYRQMPLSVAAIVASRLRSYHTDGLSDLTV